MAVDASVAVGTGVAITFDTGFFAEITNIAWSGISRESIDTSHMATPTGASVEKFYTVLSSFTFHLP